MPQPFSWKPKDATEFILYIVMVSLIIVFVLLFHYNVIETNVKKTSRCLREKTQGQRSGQYSVTAQNQLNKDMYKIVYDMNAKSYAVDCACEEGDVVNNFRNIDVYDLRDGANPKKTISSKMCQCKSDLVNGTGFRTYYTGYPGLVRFMNYKDTSFFDSNY